jgi:drug/metabolite transporter (DMT)-like permease
VQIWIAVGLTLLGAACMSGLTNLKPAVGDLLELAGAVLWAFHVIVVGLAASKMDVFVFAAGQFLVAALLHCSSALIFEQHLVVDWTQAIIPILYAGFFSAGFGFTMQVWAQKTAPAVDAALILSLEAVFAALVGHLVLHEVLSILQAIGAGLILCGILLTQLPRSRRFDHLEYVG